MMVPPGAARREGARLEREKGSYGSSRTTRMPIP